MQPWYRWINKLLQEACGVNVISFSGLPALHYVGNVAFKIVSEITMASVMMAVFGSDICSLCK
jgi:hypothetical protein